MTNPTNEPVNRQSADYRQGYADGQKNASNKWNAVTTMWGGLGLFLFLVLVFVAAPAWSSYNHRLEHNARLEACASAADIPVCGVLHFIETLIFLL